MELKGGGLSNLTWQKFERAMPIEGLLTGVRAINSIVTRSSVKGPFYYVGSGADVVLPIGMAHKDGALFIMDDYAYQNNPSWLDDNLRALASTMENPIINGELGKDGKRIITFSVDGLKMQIIMYGEDVTTFDPPEISEGCAMLFIRAPTNPYDDLGVGSISYPENTIKLFNKVKIGGYIANMGISSSFLSILSPDDIGLEIVDYGVATCPIELYRKTRNVPELTKIVECAEEIHNAVNLRNGEYTGEINGDTITDMNTFLVELKQKYNVLGLPAKQIVLNALRRHLFATEISRSLVDGIKKRGIAYGIITDEDAIRFLQSSYSKVLEFFPELN